METPDLDKWEKLWKRGSRVMRAAPFQFWIAVIGFTFFLGWAILGVSAIWYSHQLAEKDSTIQRQDADLKSANATISEQREKLAYLEGRQQQYPAAPASAETVQKFLHPRPTLYGLQAENCINADHSKNSSIVGVDLFNCKINADHSDHFRFEDGTATIPR